MNTKDNKMKWSLLMHLQSHTKHRRYVLKKKYCNPIKDKHLVRRIAPDEVKKHMTDVKWLDLRAT